MEIEMKNLKERNFQLQKTKEKEFANFKEKELANEVGEQSITL